MEERELGSRSPNVGLCPSHKEGSAGRRVCTQVQRANESMGANAITVLNGSNTDVSALEKDVAAIRKQGDSTQYTDGRGNVIYRYKNLTRKVKS